MGHGSDRGPHAHTDTGVGADLMPTPTPASTQTLKRQTRFLMSKRSRFMTLVQAATKSLTNCASPSLDA